MIQKEVMQENLTQKDITRKGGIPETDICGAIFDLDGVLLDSMAVWNDLGVRYLQKRGIQPEAGLSQILFSMSMAFQKPYAYIVGGQFCNFGIKIFTPAEQCIKP